MYFEKQANNKILLDKLNKNKHFAEVVNPIIEYSKFKDFLGESSYPALALSGGSLTSVWNDTPVNDWDLYIMDLSFSYTPNGRGFIFKLLIEFIAEKYPNSKLKIHSNNSKSEDKVDTYIVSTFFEDTAGVNRNQELRNSGLISLEVVLSEIESVHIQVIALNSKSLMNIFPPEKPIDYFFTVSNLTPDTDDTLITPIGDLSFTTLSSKINSFNLPFPEEKLEYIISVFYSYFFSKVRTPSQQVFTHYYMLNPLRRLILSPYNLIETYDFTCVSAYYYNGEVNCVDSFYEDNESKTLVINPYHSNILNFHVRVKKYSDRGYFIDSNLLMETLEKQYNLLSGDFQSCAGCTIIPISYYRKAKFAEEVKSIIDNFDSFKVNKKMEYFTL
jgi:hypothetical protein